MLSRRSLLRAVGGALAAALDPERALWVPGARRVFVPPAAMTQYGVAWEMEGAGHLSLDELAEIYLRPAAVALAHSIDQHLLRRLRISAPPDVPGLDSLVLSVGGFREARFVRFRDPVDLMPYGRLDVVVRS